MRSGATVFGLGVALLLQNVTSSVRAYRTQQSLPELMALGRVAVPDAAGIRIGIDPDAFVSQSPEALQTAVLRALGSWESLHCAAIGFQYLGATHAPVAGDGENTIGFVETGWNAYDGAPTTIAITELVYRARSDGGLDIVEADILLNDEHFDFAASDASAGALNLEAVIRHELGHLLGLAHCCELGVPGISCDAASNCTGAVMHPAYSTSESLQLSADDAAGACSLYADGACTPCAANELCVGGSCKPVCGGNICAAGEICERGSCIAGCSGCTSAERCTVDRDCSPGERCADAICSPSAPQLGDSCTSQPECGARICAETGICTEPCSEACPAAYVCLNSLCTPTRATFGERCDIGARCVSGLCLRGRDVCTRECAAESQCPGGAHCATVMGETARFCIPDGDGCSASARSSSGAPPQQVLTWFTFLLIARRMRRRTKQLS